MAAPQKNTREDDRLRLDGFEIEILKFVQEEVTSDQWKQWLRVPLEYAAARENLDLFTRLMDAGVVRALLEAGATDNVNVVFGPEDESTLHFAAAWGAEEASKALTVAGADPEMSDRRGYRSLHLAAEAGHDRVMSLFLLKGAQVGAKTCSGDTPLTLAASKGHALRISELLLGGADKDVGGDGNVTPLFKAASHNQLRVVKQLLTAGADRRRITDDGWSPLEIASNKGYASIVKMFLETGSDVDAADDEGLTALHGAATIDGPVHDNGAVVRVLLEAGADVSAKADQNLLRHPPLHLAVDARTSSIRTIRALLEGGVNINSLVTYAETPLYVACCYSNGAAVELLLRWGADETWSNDDGAIPIDAIGANDMRTTSWRRRDWLVLSRSCSTRVARVSGEDSGGVDEETEDQMMVDWRDLVDRLIGLEVDGLFRSVVGFL
ncbi:unnamed protein product [Ectocarpus sp. CCAP 1310/34]|nr:unnamed protein product [Ectocarpus sp. CCAP 1310/34]